jgi:hypothetical protein
VALLVFTMRRMGQPQLGWQYACQGLEIGLKAHVFLTTAVTIRGIATLLVDEGQTEHAIELHELTLRYPIIERSPFYRDLSVPVIDQISASLMPEIVEAAKKRGRERDLFATAQELLDQFRVRVAPQATPPLPPESPGI